MCQNYENWLLGDKVIAKISRLTFWPTLYADRPTRGGSSWYGPQMRLGLSTTYFWRFEWLASETSEIRPAILWRYATPCRPVIDCKMNDLE